MKNVNNGPKKVANRRSFLKKGMVAAGAGTALFGQTNSVITGGDVAILRFLAAAEIIPPRGNLWVTASVSEPSW